MDFTVLGGQSVTGYIPTYHADVTDDDLKRKASVPEAQPTPEAVEPNLGYMGDDGKPVVFKAPEANTGRIEGKANPVPAAALHDEVLGRLTEHSGLASHADMQMAGEVAAWARGTYGEKQRQLDEDFLKDMNDPDITGDNDRLMERCNQFVTDRISDVHRNGNVLNEMHPFEDAHTYAERIMNYIRGGWEAIETDEWKAVRTMAAAEDYEGLKKFYNIDENKVVDDMDAPLSTGIGGPGMTLSRPQKIVKKTDDEIREEIGEKVNGALSRNFMWVYERMKPDLSDEGAAIVDHAIMRGGFDLNDADAWRRLCRENRDEASKVKFLVDASRPTEEALWVDTGYETWKQLRDMVVKAGVGIGENMRRYIGLSSRHIESQLDAERYERMIAEGVPADEAKKQIDEMRSEREIADMANERDRLAIRRAELDIDDMTYHKSWDGYGWFGRSVKGAFTTLPYMGVNAVPVAGFVMNTFSHMQDMEDQINQEGGDPRNGRMLRAFGAVAWAAVEKLEFDGMFGRTLTNMEKKTLWKHFLRDGVDKMAVNGWELGKAYGKEWAVKTGYETFQEGVQGGIESVEHDIGFFNHLDPKQRMDAHKMLRNAVGRFFDDMKESVGTMAGLSLGGAGVGTLRNVRRQHRAALDRESIDEILRRRNSVEAMVDGTWVNADVSGTKAEHQRKVLDRLTSLWTEAKDRFEAMGKIRAEFGFNDEQVRKVADWLDIEQTALEGIAKEFGTEDLGEEIARLAGVKHDFVVGNDTVFDPKRLYAAFNANIKVEDVEVEDKDAKPVVAADSERLVALKAEKAEAEQAVRDAKVGSARRGAQKNLRRINQKIKAEEAKKPEPQQPTRTIRRVTIPMVKPDGTTTERHIVINETTGALTEGMVKQRGFATSVARACRKAGVDLMGIKITDDESERAASDAFYKAASQDPTAALDVATKVPGVTFFDKGNFHIVDEDTGKRLADAHGIIHLAVRAERATERSGNLSLTHETTHGIVKFAEELGVFGDTKSPDYKPEENDMVMLFRQLFGNPMQEGELFNEEGLSDAMAEFLRDEYDFGKFQSVDQRRMAERAFDGVAGLLKYAYNQVFHKQLVTPRDVNQRREAQLAVFQAIRQGDFRGLSKYAGITFKADNRAKVDAKVAERTKEQSKKSTKAPAKAAWRLRRRQGVQGDRPQPEASTGVPGASGSASGEEARLRAENERLVKELNAALAGGGVTVPARAGGQHVVHSPITWIPLKVEWAWMPRKDVVPAGAGSSIQERFRSLNEASKQKLRNRAKRGTFVPERLTADNVGDRGAPIVAGGNICLSGNGRMMLLSMVAERGGYGEYLDAVRAWCRANGVQDCPADMLDKEPVLVQRVVEGESTEALDKFAMECNRSDHEELTTSEKAKGGVKAITKALMRLYDVPPSGDFMSESNWGFIRAFYKSLGEEVPETMDGRIEPEAGLRVQRAFLAKLLGGEESNDEKYQTAVFTLINTLLAGGDGTATVRNALIRNGAELYALMGNRGSYNVIPELRAAVETYVGWRAAVQRNPSLSLKDYVDTPDFFRVTSPIQDALTRLIEMRYFNAVLKKYNELVSRQDVDAQGMLAIAGAERLTSGQLLAMAEREVVEKDADGNPVTPYVTHEPSWVGYALQPQSAPAVSAPVAENKPDAKPTKAEREEERKKAQAERDAAMAAHLAQMTPEERAEYDALMAKAETMPTVSEALAAAEEILRKREDEKPFVPCAAARGTAVVPNALAPGRPEHKLTQEVTNDGKPETVERKWNLGAGVWDYLRLPFVIGRGAMPVSKQDEAGRGLWTGKPLDAATTMLLEKFQGKCPHFMGNKNDMTERTVRTLFEKMSKSEREHYKTVVDCFGGGGCWGLTLALTSFTKANRLIVNEFTEGRLEKIRLLQTRDGTFEAEVRQFFKDKVAGEIFDGIVREAKNIEGFRTRFIQYVKSLSLTRDELGMAYAVYDSMMYRMQYGETENIGGKEMFSPRLQIETSIREVGADAIKATELAQAFNARGGSITYVCGDAKNQVSFGAKAKDGRISRTNADGVDFVVPSGHDVMKVCDPPYYRTTGYNEDGSSDKVGLAENPFGWGYKDTDKMLTGIVDSGSGIVYTDEAWFYKNEFREEKNDADYGQGGLFALGDSVWKQEQDILCNIVNKLDHFDCAGEVGKKLKSMRFETLGVHHGHDNHNGAEERADDGRNGLGNGAEGISGQVHGRGGSVGVHEDVGRVDAGNAGEDASLLRGLDTSRGRGGSGESADRAVAKEACVQAIEKAVEDAGEAVTPEGDAAIRHSVRMVRDERMADYARLVSANARDWLTARRKELRKRMRAAGYTDLVWHGTYGDDFNVFRFGDNNGHGVKAAYFTYRRQTAQNYAAIRGMDAVLDGGYDLINTRRFFVNPGKVYEYDEAKTPLDFDGFVAMLKKAYADGYDSVRCHNVLDDQGARLDTNDENMTFLEPEDAAGNGEGDFITDTLIVFDRDGNPGANRIKAADAVTFADGGLPIPLEMRADQSLADVRYSVAMGRRAREEARAMIEKYRPDYRAYPAATESAVKEIADFDTPKERKAALYWFCKATVRLPEDVPLISEAILTAERAHIDAFQYDRPGEIIDKFNEYRPVAKPIDPDTVPELSDKRVLSNGIVTYLVQDDKAGQTAMRRILNTHLGKDEHGNYISPWCLLHDNGRGGCSAQSWNYWHDVYNVLPKRVAFKDGKLVAFMATDANFTLGGSNAPSEQWWDRANEPHSGIPFTRSIPAPSGEGAVATEHCELQGGVVLMKKITRGDPKAKAGRYEEWRADGTYKLREDGEGRDHHFELWVDGVEQEHRERHDNIKLDILKTADGRSILDAMVEVDDINYPFKVRYGTYHNELVIRQGYDEAFISEGASIGPADFNQIAKDLFAALKRNDRDAVDSLVADLKSRASAGSPDQRHSVTVEDREHLVAEVNRGDPRFSVKAVGKYAGELRRMAWGLKLGQHRAMEDAARMMSPLIPENAVIVPMPNHEGKPISTMILAYYISGQEDKGIDIVPALEAEPHESNYKHKKRTKGKSTAIVMHRTDAEIPSGRPVVIIDNVVASGATYKAAQKVLPEADLVSLADATRGRVDFDPSLQDLQKRMAENPGNLAASLELALAKPSDVDASAWRSDTITADDETPAEREQMRHSLRVVERNFDEDTFNAMFGGGESRNRVGVRIGKPIDVVTGYAAAQLLGGKDIKVEDLDAILKNVGVRGASAPDVLASAQGVADRLRESAKTRVERADPSLYTAFANESLLERVKKQIHESIVTGAAVADPEIGARLQRAVQAQARRAMDAAKGFTARQMQQELPISLADAVFAEAEYERTPEEKAKLEEMRKKREEEAEAEKQAAADAGLSLEEYREQLQADRDANTVYVEPDPEQKRYFEELMNRAKAAKEKEDEKEAKRKAKAKANAEAKKDEDGSDGGEDEGGAGDGGEGILPIETVKRIAPIFGDADTFAMFVAEWCADNVVKRHPEIPNTAQMWRNPVAVRELIKTAQSVLEDLAMDVLGSPAINAARNYADRSIILLAERKTYKGVVHHIAYTYDMIHNQALRLSRRKLVGDLVKAGDKATGAKGRFSATQEMKTRTTFAKTELWWRHLRPFLTMSEEKLTEEIARLQGIVDGYNKESEEDGYDADNFQEYRDACDKLALANRYGGMVRWMPSKIQAAAAEIMMDLNGRRAEFEAMRDERDADNKRIREAIIKAVEAGGTERYRKEANRLMKTISNIATEYRGQLVLELKNLIRYCKDEKLRQDALDAIDELDFLISRGSEKYRVTYGQGLKEVNAALADIYGSAIAGARHLKEKIPEGVALQIFNQGRDILPTYGQLLQLYASCLQKDYKDNVEKHDRSDQIEIMREALDPKDIAFHAWAIEWYAHNRQELSDAVEEITGLSISSPDNLYCPVRMDDEKDSFDVNAIAWCPVPSALNRRVKHGRDFGEKYNFLDMLQEQCEIRAQLIGYGVAGIRLRDTIVHHDVQDAVRRNVSRKDMKVVSDHVRDVLVQSVERKNHADAWLKFLNVSRKWIAYFYLSGNLFSASKQFVSMAMWAVNTNFKDATRYFASAFTREGWERINELRDTDGYKARYMMGWSEETLNLMLNPTKSKWIKMVENPYRWGMTPTVLADKIGSLWMAQGFYGDMKQRMLDLGFNEDEARERAATLTWSAVEQTQQSGRIENMNSIQRKQGGWNALFQFMSSQILQNAFEIQAWKEVKAGTPGAKGRLLRAVIVNHLIIPALLETIAIGWRAIMGEAPLPDDPEDWPPFLKELAFQMLFSQTAPLFFISSIVRTTWDKVVGTKSRYRDNGSAPAVQGALRVYDIWGSLIMDSLTYGAQEFTPFEVEDEVSVEKLQTDILRAADSVLAPVRHIHKAVKNRTE